MNSFSKSCQKLSFHHLLINTHLHFLLFLLINITLSPLATHGCNEQERRALLDFKSSMSDPANRLISWKEGIQHQNCCNWQGIRCSSDSFHIISINLRNTELEIHYQKPTYGKPVHSTAIHGKFSSSLFNITNLEYLDLSYNDFQKSQIPLQISDLTKLTHLDPKNSNFSSSISTGLANLTSLRYLDLSCAEDFYYSCLELSSTKWMSGLGNSQELRLTGIDLSETTSSQDKFAQHISYLSNLRELDLSGCNISSTNFPIHQFHNLSRISSLMMSFNYGLNSQIPVQLANLTSLSILDLSDCGLHGLLDVSGNFDLQPDLTRMFQHQWPKLKTLSVAATKVIGSNIPFSISNAPMLVSLSLSGCSIQGSLPHSIYNLSRLQFLELSDNNITGYIHSSISNLKYLNHLDLSYNNFQGSIPKSICEISPLRILMLNNNNITGTIPSCISKLQNLGVFHVYANSFFFF
ncbi:hypothetical protein MKW92_014971 [Papaver armeniacum]|nr:hypothetical protein MKW92_014971 [Papaver armeniacum]